MFTKLRSCEKTFKFFPLFLEVKEKEMRLRNDGWVKKRQFTLLKNGSGWMFQKCLINVCENQEQFLGKTFTLRNNSRKTILNKLLKFSWYKSNFLDYHLSSYGLGDSVLSEKKQAAEVEFLQMSFQNHVRFRTESLV